MQTKIYIGLIAAPGSFLSGVLGVFLLHCLWPPVLPPFIAFFYMLLNLRIIENAIEKTLNNENQVSFCFSLFVPFICSFVFTLLGFVAGVSLCSCSTCSCPTCFI